MIELLLAAALTLPTPDLSCRVRRANGSVVRSEVRRNLFRRLTGFPRGRQGHVVDHLVPLACGGCDVPSNMTWLTVEEHRGKTLWERRPCASWWDGGHTRALIRGRALGKGRAMGPSARFSSAGSAERPDPPVFKVR